MILWSKVAYPKPASIFLPFDLYLTNMGQHSVFTLIDRSHRQHQIQFDVGSGTFTWADSGKRVSLDPVGFQYACPSEPWEHLAERSVSPTNPAGKAGEKRVVKIQLGLSCNFSCTYCCQDANDSGESAGTKRIIPIKPAAARTDDVDAFLSNIQNWLNPVPGIRFELWGGEPFIYWKVFKKLAEGLMALYPDATIFTISNGSLISKDIADWYIEHPTASISISHDGPGRHRDQDVLDNPELRRMILTLHEQGRPVGFNCVLTADNLSVVAIRQYIADKLGLPPESIRLSTEGLITPFDGSSQKLVPSHNDLGVLFREMVSKKSMFIFYSELQDFIQGISTGRCASSIGQKCGLDRSDAIVVALKTQDVVTCQNTLPVGKHRIGHVDNLEEVKLDTAWHWKARPNCGGCPVLSFCKGSCLYLEGEAFDRACESQLKYRLPFVAAALYFITGFVLTQVEWKGGIIDLDYLGDHLKNLSQAA